MKILKLDDIRVPLPFNINRKTSAFTMHDIIKHDAYEIDFDVYLPTKKMNLQRPFVWTLQQKQELILSLLKGVDISTMALISFDHKVMKVVDGKQRLSTWVSFAKNEFPIVWDGIEYYCDDLDKMAKWAILQTSVVADIAYEYKDRPISDEWKIKWFELINFIGTPQEADHMNKLKA